MPTVVFVCTANICRSPVAEVLFADWLRRRAIAGDWRVSSAGTWAEEDAPASIYSSEILAERGLDLKQHRSRRVDRQMVEAADLLLCMTGSQREALQAEFPDLADRIHLLSAMAGPDYDIFDPYGGPREGYVAMVSELQQLLEAGAARIVELAGRAPEPAAPDTARHKK
jgi:protein-tyrosine-phosphatase